MVENLLIDFDSTILGKETLPTLLETALKNRPDKDKLLQEVQAITRAGMRGDISFQESLSRRVSLLPLTKELLDQTIEKLKDELSPSFIDQLPELNKYNLHIVSGGFTGVIIALTTDLGILPSHIHANTLVFEGNLCKGVKTDCPLAGNLGKVKIARSLKLRGKTAIIGEGYTDFQVKQYDLADYFIYYNEFVTRPSVMEQADWIANNFYEVNTYLKELSYTESDKIQPSLKQTNR